MQPIAWRAYTSPLLALPEANPFLSQDFLSSLAEHPQAFTSSIPRRITDRRGGLWRSSSESITADLFLAIVPSKATLQDFAILNLLSSLAITA